MAGMTSFGSRQRLAGRPDGIILITTLLVLFFLILLTTSLLAINRHNIGLLVNLESHEKAFQAALSGIAFAQHQIEQDTTWGTYAANDDYADSNFRVWENQVGETLLVAGVLEGGKSHFQLSFSLDLTNATAGHTRYDDGEIAKNPASGSWTTRNSSYKSLNNFSSLTGSPPAPNNSRTGALYRNVPPGMVHLISTGYSRGVTRTVEVVLQRMAGVDSSAVANGDLNISLSGGGNKWTVDSKDPNRNLVRSNVKILAPDSAKVSFGSSKDAGTAWTKGDITLGGIIIGDGIGAPDDATEKSIAEAATNAVMKPDSSPAYDIPNLDPTAIPRGGTVKEIAPGTYVFVKSDQVRLPDGSLSTGGKIKDKNDGSDAIYLKDYSFIVPGPVKITGDLNIDRDVSVTVRPKFAIGYNKDLQLQSTAPSLEVTGNLNVKGELKGQGSIIASTDNATVTFEGKSQLSTVPDKGVAVYSGGTVNMNPVDPTANAYADPGVGMPEYYGKFQEAMNNFVTRVSDSKYGGQWSGDKGLNEWKEWDSKYREFLGGKLSDGTDVGDLVANDVNPPSGGGSYPTGTLRNETITYDPLSDPQFLSSKDTQKTDILNFISGTTGGVYDFVTNAWTTAGTPVANFKATTGPNTTTLGRYLRVKQYMKTIADGDPKTEWLDWSKSDRSQDTQGMVWTQVDAYAEKAEEEEKSLQSYMSVSLTITAQDMEFLGLVYAKGDFTANAGNNKFRIEGALVTMGNLKLSDASDAHFTYNPDYIRLLRRGSGSGTKLEQVSWLVW